MALKPQIPERGIWNLCELRNLLYVGAPGQAFSPAVDAELIIGHLAFSGVAEGSTYHLGRGVRSGSAPRRNLLTGRPTEKFVRTRAPASNAIPPPPS